MLSKQYAVLVRTLTILLVVLNNNNVVIKAQSSAREINNDGEEPLFSFRKTHVTINNHLGDNITVNIHCQSKDDDIGSQDVGDGGYYEISFRPSLWKNTLFYCDMSWNDVHGHFDIYDQPRDEDRCRTCFWDVRKDGLHGTNCEGGAEQIWFRWDDQYKPPPL
ncbi:hypothetical protein LIER_43566 [Lithospermum erythrorhizon]|uniref:S-protein homolog n=1 Tax=Lithospermum erythrorhizon TaxID=34254 RepID=A0AAV3QCZ2_LITER